MTTRFFRKLALLSTTGLMTATMAHAQDVGAPAAQPTEETEATIVVTGSQIQGAQINDVLPVTVLDEQQIENTGASSGDELFRSIPQAGTVAFNEQNATTQNNVRGDVGSVNLRDLGTGNTLLLMNGRRMNLHPGFQTELLVPVVSPDTNEIAPGSVRRIEVLRDGASAIYGADAVAGVINTVLKGNMKGGFLETDWRASDGTSLYSYSINGGLGLDFGSGRGNLTVYGGHFHENGLDALKRDYSRDDDKLPLLVGTDFEGDASFNNRNTFGPFGQFDIQAPSTRTPIRDDDFYLQPSTFSGCDMDFGNGICANAGTTPTTAVRYNTIFGNTLISRKNRYNAMALLNYELTDSLEAYFEGSYYRSENQRINDASAILSAVPVGIARTAYWNPFGPTTSVSGGANPNRLPGTTIPSTGADVIMERYRFVDAGNRGVFVDKDAYRLVGGLRGNFGAWEFDTGFVYSKSKVTDLETNRVSLTAMQQSINRTTSDAYNPFNGGCIEDPGQGDCTPNPASVIDTFRINVSRVGGTSLALADFKISRDDLIVLPAGNLGVATGVEWRRETFYDDRDARLDGTITFTDSVTGVFNGSDVAGTSPSPDTDGTRTVYSAFAEIFVPVVSSDMNIPLVEDFNVQMAGRIERFEDIDATAVVPRVAASWTTIPGVTFRGAWSQGFRAPNLVQVNDDGTTRSNTRDDFVVCQAQVRKGLLSSLDACPGAGVISFRSGARSLKPEDSDSINLGIVLEPKFMPGLTLTADYWQVKQAALVGTFGDDNAIALDLLRRLGGSTNPNVIRAAPTADDIELFTGTGLTPAGKIVQVLDPYLNLDSRVSKGWDIGMNYKVPDFGIGQFRLRLNAARLKSFVQSAGVDGEELLAGIAAGKLPADVTVGGLGELLEIEGRPKWRVSGSVNWESGPVEIGLFGQYTGKVWDTSVVRDILLVSDNPNANYYRVKDQFLTNLSVSYTINNDTALNGTRLRFAINNLFDKDPPLADETYGFYSELYTARGRVFHVELRKKF
ncbi:MAG: TonB-dependent receptor [Sphingomonadales bacterium 35-56-22]|uniref:TonB-dependent receptor domain-containing protein n=1 Tax=Sphingorhabdus sp. TaxID=1902408 RepID=UPI000BC612BD|nr:TonB-dependent receptor [Sphingorhabdus sp.]OYY15040.1 MAG: TonB-dependent receptor [Sphingomonadales bacterium 35-56-22]OYY96540.1 MAG: TonB-dependent receptor [Sphingomonadales bacterium 28-56-43]OYZ60020.1 MAG: TonB-dependent receptor [Sphingomonadales bacterium 24-56-14]OZA82187.1 MAG: TonB-dependent receptor [Sphingomonadales bacterium 39-57-19]HQS13398.1 TonB-dependent receptor [Sphingorhabdus sp.]